MILLGRALPSPICHGEIGVFVEAPPSGAPHPFDCDFRANPAAGIVVVTEVKARGLSLENGMAVTWNGRRYHGADALHVLALLGSEDGTFNKLNRLVFSRPKLGKFLYPAMAAGRRLTLRFLGRPPGSPIDPSAVMSVAASSRREGQRKFTWPGG